MSLKGKVYTGCIPDKVGGQNYFEGVQKRNYRCKLRICFIVHALGLIVDAEISLQRPIILNYLPSLRLFFLFPSKSLDCTLCITIKAALILFHTQPFSSFFHSSCFNQVFCTPGALLRLFCSRQHSWYPVFSKVFISQIGA